MNVIFFCLVKETNLGQWCIRFGVDLDSMAGKEIMNHRLMKVIDRWCVAFSTTFSILPRVMNDLPVDFLKRRNYAANSFSRAKFADNAGRWVLFRAIARLNWMDFEQQRWSCFSFKGLFLSVITTPAKPSLFVSTELQSCKTTAEKSSVSIINSRN